MDAFLVHVRCPRVRDIQEPVPAQDEQGFWTIVLIIVIGQLFITEMVPNFFNVEPMLRTADWKWNPSGAEDLGIIILASSAVVWVRELYILVTWPFRKRK